MSATNDAVRSFRTFVPLASNEAALAMMLRWATDCVGVGAPVVLVGRTDVGKTHLARAALAARDPARSPRAISAADLTTRFITALKEGRILELRERLRRPGCLIIEHLEDLRDKPETLAEVFTIIAPLVAERRVVLTITQRDASLAPVRDVRRAFPEATVARIGRPSRAERREVFRAAEARETAAIAAPPVDEDGIIAKVLSDLGDEDVEHGFLRRRLIVLDPSLRALEKPLEDAAFYVLCSRSFEGDDVASFLTGRVVVTRSSAALFDMAPVLDMGIIGLEAVLPDGPISKNAALAVTKLISAAATNFHLRRRRHAWVLLLHPEGRHAFRELQ